MKKDDEREVPDPQESLEEVPTVVFPRDFLVKGPNEGLYLIFFGFL